MDETLDESCSSRLQQWATKTMGYSGVMTAQDWKQLCEDDLGKFWLNVINSTHPQRAVATVKKTLLSYPNNTAKYGSRLSVVPRKRDDEWQSLVEQRNKLAREHAALQNGIQLKNTEISDIHAKLLSLEQSHTASQNASVELVTRCSLLSSHMTSCDQWCQMIKEYQQRVKAHHDCFASHKGDEGSDVTFVLSQSARHDTLESLTKHVVKDALFCTKQLLTILADQSSDKSAVQEVKGRAWKSVEELLANHPLSDILWSLCDVAKEAERQLQSHTSGINLKQDTRQLRFHCLIESGELKDVSNQTSLLQAVRSHVKEAQIDHVDRSRSTEKSQIAVNNLQQKLAALQQRVCVLLEKHYQSNPQLLQLTKNLMKLECELAGAKAALQTLSSSEITLRKACEEHQSLVQQLHEKQKRIEEYASRTATKQNKIELLIRQNSSAKHHLLKQRREVISYAQQRVVSQHAILVVSADHLMDTSDNESSLLNKLKLHCLPQHEINSTDMVAAVLGCQGYQPCELMLEKVVELLQKAEELKKELRERQLSLDRLTLDTKLFEVHRRLIDDSQQHAHKMVLPQICNQLQKANNSIHQCVDIRGAIDEWWTQPAQLSVPWVTRQGMNVNQWLEQWRTLLSKLE